MFMVRYRTPSLPCGTIAAMEIRITNIEYLLSGTAIERDREILIRDGLIAEVGTGVGSDAGDPPGDTGIDATVIDATGMAVMPSFKNAHTHAAMTLLRGYGDDMPLQPWLTERIWPAEAVLTPDDIYWGTRLAAIEMIRSGTTFANDMYFMPAETIRAFRDSGMRAAVGLALFDFDDPQRRRREQAAAEQLLASFDPTTDPPRSDVSGEPAGTVTRTGHPPRVFLTVAPHSPYTSSAELLSWAAELAASQNLVYHTHLSETRTEVNQILDRHGYTPFAWLESLGVFEKTGERTIAAHGVWITPEELALAARRGITVAHNPASNMKLASGAFPYGEYKRHGIPLMLAPDGVASNNNLDMFDEMKLAALMQKLHTGDATALPAAEILRIAWGARSEVFRDFGVSGSISPGEPADLVLVDLSHPQMTPVHTIESNLVYAANGSVVDTVICGGEILMLHREIPGQDEVIREARNCAASLVKRAGAGA